MKDVSAISGLMGSYLLKGWIMLGDACPSCDEVPLLEDPSNGLKYCMKCSPPINSSINLNSNFKGVVENNQVNSASFSGVKQEVSAECNFLLKKEIGENINKMMFEIMKIGINKLQDFETSTDERLEIVGKVAEVMKKLVDVHDSLFTKKTS